MCNYWYLGGKERVCNARAEGDAGLIPGSGRSPGGGDGNPLQYSCLENPVNRGAWQAIANRDPKLLTRSDLVCTHMLLVTGGVGLVAKSCLTLVTPWTVAHQAPLSMGFSRQEYWSGLPSPPPGDLPDPGIKPESHVSCIGRQVLYH